MTRVIVTGGSGFIGRQVIALLVSKEIPTLNLDIHPPGFASEASWGECSILESNKLTAFFQEFKPTQVVHLAAHAEMGGRSLADFDANITGTANVLEACRNCPSVDRLIMTSTQHVRKPGSPMPRSDTDYEPYMLYGESKVLAEKLTRNSGLTCSWTIIRPTAVWGPHHQLLAKGLWRLLKKRAYIHPANDDVKRSYGYVKNVAWQICGILESKREQVHGKTFYVADGNMWQRDWVSAFSVALSGLKPRTLPRPYLRLLALLGDGIIRCGGKFPLYTDRYRNMVTSNEVPTDAIYQLLGSPPYSMDQGIAETVQWLNESRMS